MKIAIAGSDGFVGKNVCALLTEAGHTIIPIDITRGLDLCDTSIIEQVPSVDCFVHLANLVYVPASYEDPAKFYSVNCVQ